MADHPTSVDRTHAAKRPLRRRLEKLAWVLDSAIPLPGGFSIGIDGLIGLLPGVGDGAAALISAYIIAAGVRSGAPKSVVARMVGNVATEAAFGAIPLVGDFFDIVFKANERNVVLLEAYLDRPDATTSSSRWLIIAIIVALIAIVAFSVWLSLLFLRSLIGLIA